MAKDPFKQLPGDDRDIAYERHRGVEARHDDELDDTEEMSKGAAPRNLMKDVSKYAMPLAVLGILIWLFMPASDPKRSAPPAPEVTLDETRQMANTSALMDTLKEQAAKAPPAQTEKPPQGSATGQMPTPMPIYTPSPELEKMKAELEKREQEIRASPLEAGPLKLIGDEKIAGNAFQGSRLQDLQSDIAATEKARAEAARTQEAANERVMAAYGKQDNAKPKNPNVEFLSEQKELSASSELIHQQPALAASVINQGSVIRTVLLTGVNSDLPGAITAQVTSDVYDSTTQRNVLIPKGSKLIGSYSSQVAVGQERVLMAMNRLILPDGTWISLAGAAASDLMGQSGLPADVNNHFFKIFSTSFVLGAASLLLPDDKNTITSTSNAGGVTTAGNTFAIALNDTLKAILERNKNIGPTLSLKPGQEFVFLVAKDMAMRPYR